MFTRARRRLTLLYVALFALVLIVFSVVFFAVVSVVLQPAFDIGPEPPTPAAAERAYRTAVERIGLVLVLADAAVVALVAAAAWFLAGRTLGPIRAAHDRQRRFVADSSHEMRSPITVVRSTAEQALADVRVEGPVREALEAIVGSSARLAALTDDLLTLARSDAAELDIRPEDLDLSVLTSEIVDRRLDAHPSHAPVELRLASDVLVRGDATTLERILGNLVDNAVTYTPASGHVRVVTRAVGASAVVEVRDDGVGISTSDRERVFEPFFRVRSDAAAPAGNGLGLAIARALAARLGGTIDVDSEPGRGSTFRLTLPRAR
jgi:two-component system OmpR family sensor kinase